MVVCDRSNSLFYLSCLPGNVALHCSKPLLHIQIELVELTCASFSDSMALLNFAISIFPGETVHLFPCHYLFFLYSPIALYTLFTIFQGRSTLLSQIIIY